MVCGAERGASGTDPPPSTLGCFVSSLPNLSLPSHRPLTKHFCKTLKNGATHVNFGARKTRGILWHRSSFLGLDHVSKTTRRDNQDLVFFLFSVVFSIPLKWRQCGTQHRWLSWHRWTLVPPDAPCSAPPMLLWPPVHTNKHTHGSIYSAFLLWLGATPDRH